ncbi:MAG: hypothetical protein MJA27_28250, partial [Pseudanabaenales cyanobacterium]|nr:hypothetical protein [Pseudanabaenales cyanobacterium]
MMTIPFTTTRFPSDMGSSRSAITTNVPFELPQGLETATGQVCRQGQMRLATGADELAAQRAAQMMDNDAYGVLVRLSRVISFTDQPCLSPASPDHPDTLSPDDLGNLFMPDLHYLIERYNTINPP